jgi:cytochrome c oxidase assembly factor CtaG
VAAAAAIGAVQLTAAYNNRGRARLQFGWVEDAREDFAIAGGVAAASLAVSHRVRKAVLLASQQAKVVVKEKHRMRAKSGRRIQFKD